jgi:Domain of Unknown Function with PDB structure (DUF3857)/Transglutaminase-like superfamily
VCIHDGEYSILPSSDIRQCSLPSHRRIQLEAHSYHETQDNYCQRRRVRRNNETTFQESSGRTCSPVAVLEEAFGRILFALRSVVFVLFRRLFLLCLALVPLSAFGFADWQQPTPEELKMTSDPAAPNSPAVYLFREETVSDDLHMHSMYARIKILNEKGKEMFSDIQIGYEAGNFSITDIGGRTIHPDGTVIPLTAKPIDKLVVKSGNFKEMEKVFSMPDVQVGSIIEYRWKLRYDSDKFFSPSWYIAQPVFVHKAHYHFSPTKTSVTILHKERGHEDVADVLLYSFSLPPGVKVKDAQDGYDLVVENIAALPNEDYMPPFRSFSYRVVFYYSPWRTPDEYWRNQGKYWSKEVDRFANPSGKIRGAVSQIVVPGDSDEQKVEKIYAEMMKLDNTSFTRTHSAEENKAEGLRVKSADDIWEQKRGTSDEITRLFIAMVRAAGLKAYGMIVVNRDQNVLQTAYMEWDQLDEEVAIVPIGGKEVFFDPGQRYCEFAKLHWKHTWVNGVRQTDGGTQLATTPGLNYQDNKTDRIAQLSLDPDGKLHGFVRLTMTGAEALRWRHAALRGDEEEVKKDFDQYLEAMVPSGVQVSTNHFVGLTDYRTPLLVQVDVSGSLGTSTGKRVVVPAVFFEASAKPLFVIEKRENPVDLHYPYSMHDQFSVTLPPNLSVESVPKEENVPFAPNADYVAKFAMQGNMYLYGRLFRLANPFYKVDEYSSLRTFYQKTNTDDQEQVVLKFGTPTTGANGSSGNGK